MAVLLTNTLNKIKLECSFDASYWDSGPCIVREGISEIHLREPNIRLDFDFCLLYSFSLLYWLIRWVNHPRLSCSTDPFSIYLYFMSNTSFFHFVLTRLFIIFLIAQIWTGHTEMSRKINMMIGLGRVTDILQILIEISVMHETYPLLVSRGKKQNK